MNLVALKKTLKQQFYCAAIAFSIFGSIQLDMCGAMDTDEDIKIQSFSAAFCSPENTPDAFCAQPH